MRKSEFLQELKEALQGEVSGGVLQENLRYYDNYITQETAAGRREEDVIDEIGSPRLIARTIIDSSEAAGDVPEQGPAAIMRIREAAMGSRRPEASVISI